nr:hypothetical protein [uncultured Draconibacterium sp.]
MRNPSLIYGNVKFPSAFQADWNQSNAAHPGYIRNKPTVPSNNDWEVYIDFEAVEAFTYTCPYAMKFTAMNHQQANAPTLSVALNTNMAQYDDLVITPDAVGLVTLIGIKL